MYIFPTFLLNLLNIKWLRKFFVVDLLSWDTWLYTKALIAEVYRMPTWLSLFFPLECFHQLF